MIIFFVGKCIYKRKIDFINIYLNDTSCNLHKISVTNAELSIIRMFNVIHKILMYKC